MERLFITEKISTLLPRIKEFVVNELYPLETTENLTHNFSYIEPVLQQKRALVKKSRTMGTAPAQRGWWSGVKSL